MSRKRKDIVLVQSPTEDGKGVAVLRARADRVEAGVMRPLEEGRPIAGEVVRLTRRPEWPLLFDAETELVAPQAEAEAQAAPARTSGGPPQVATETYRRGWDAVWRRPDSRPN